MDMFRQPAAIAATALLALAGGQHAGVEVHTGSAAVDRALNSAIESRVGNDGKPARIIEQDTGKRPKLPKQYKHAVPVYQQAHVDGVLVCESGKNRDCMITLGTDDSRERVFQWYGQKLDASGWTMDEGEDLGRDGGTLVAEKGKMRFVVYVSKGDHKSVIGTNLTTEK